ncbi:MAG: hypothetical protein IJA18_00610 [Ruminococcus sp.]|nr:hypothetical protein [Ruminococcus sp.]
MKKVISAILVGAMCAGAFTACGDKKDDKSSGGLSKKVDGEYVSILSLYGRREVFEDGIDEGIKYSMNLAEEYEKENDDEYNPHLIKFSDGEFLMPDGYYEHENVHAWDYYDGTFSVKDGKIKFSYENHIDYDKSKTNINCKSILDMDVIKGTSEKLEGLSAEEKKEIKKQEMEKMNILFTVEFMQKLNETGSYFKELLPAMNCSDKWSDFSVLPFIRFALNILKYDSPNTLYVVDDFLCTDTYGIELDGKYKRGKAFTLKHDLEDTIENDEQSRLLGGNEEKETYLNRLIQIANSQYNCDDVETTIEFSDGEWEWFNADGGLINNGRYDESKDYPGLIMMYVDEDSKNYPDYALYTYPLWFYIADDGEIYYPGYVKMD